MAQPQNTTKFRIDDSETYVLLSPSQVAILACYCNLYGLTPPPRVFNTTWSLICKARTDAVSCRELGACVDAIGPHLVDALRAEEVVK